MGFVEEGGRFEDCIGGESCGLIEATPSSVEGVGVLTNCFRLDRKWSPIDFCFGPATWWGDAQFRRGGKSNGIRQQRDFPFNLRGFSGGRWISGGGFQFSAGSSAKAPRQVSFDMRCDMAGFGPKCVYAKEIFQVGTSGRFIESDRTRLVWVCFRPEGGVSPCGDSGTRSEMVEVLLGWTAFSFCINAIWAAAFAVFFYQVGERICQDFASWLQYSGLLSCKMFLSGGSVWGCNCGVCRRLLCVCEDKRVGSPDSRGDYCSIDEKDGMDSSFGQGDLGSGSTLEFFGLAGGHSQRLGVYPSGETDQVFGEFRSYFIEKVCDGERVGESGRENCFSDESVCPCSDSFEDNFRSDKPVYRWKPRVVGACGSFGGSQIGFGMAQGSFEEESGSICLAAGPSFGVGDGRMYGDWLGCDVEDWQQAAQSTGDLEPGASVMGYPNFGNAGGEVSHPSVCKSFKKLQFSDYHRQSGLLAYIAKGLKNSRAEQTDNRNSGFGVGNGRSDGGRALDSFGAERRPGRFVPDGGRERLDRPTRGLDGNSRNVAPTHRRQIRGRMERQATPLQLKIRASLLGKGKRSVRDLAQRRVVVRLPASRNDQSRDGLGGSARDEGSGRHSRVATPAVVAGGEKDGSDMVAFRLGSGGVSGGPVGSRRSPQERQVGFLGGGVGRKAKVTDLSEKHLKETKAQFVASAIEPITLRQYKSQIFHYETFCSARNLQAFPMVMEVVEDCTVALMYSGFPSIALNVWSAICYFQQSRGFVKPPKSAILKALHVKAEKMSALTAKKPRDAIPLTAIRKFCASREAKTKEGIAAVALVTVGIRALLRCNELQKLKLKHLSFREGMMVIDLGIRKNHRQRAACIFIERSGNEFGTCPVAWMEEHLRNRRREGAREEDSVFISKKGKVASPAVIKSMIDLVIRNASECRGLNIATHSMRISGAVYLMMAGHSSTEIQIMGDWKSDVFLRYLRTLGLAVKRATTGMGL